MVDQPASTTLKISRFDQDQGWVDVGYPYTCDGGYVPAGGIISCTRTHTITQADIEAGRILED
jgi:hypothetical protein